MTSIRKYIGWINMTLNFELPKLVRWHCSWRFWATDPFICCKGTEPPFCHSVILQCKPWTTILFVFNGDLKVPIVIRHWFFTNQIKLSKISSYCCIVNRLHIHMDNIKFDLINHIFTLLWNSLHKKSVASLHMKMRTEESIDSHRFFLLIQETTKGNCCVFTQNRQRKDTQTIQGTYRVHITL
jgi:hypothetical protein